MESLRQLAEQRSSATPGSMPTWAEAWTTAMLLRSTSAHLSVPKPTMCGPRWSLRRMRLVRCSTRRRRRSHPPRRSRRQRRIGPGNRRRHIPHLRVIRRECLVVKVMSELVSDRRKIEDHEVRDRGRSIIPALAGEQCLESTEELVGEPEEPVSPKPGISALSRFAVSSTVLMRSASAAGVARGAMCR